MNSNFQTELVHNALAVGAAFTNLEQLTAYNATPQQLASAQSVLFTCQEAFLQTELKSAEATNDIAKVQMVSSQLNQLHIDMNFFKAHKGHK